MENIWGRRTNTNKFSSHGKSNSNTSQDAHHNSTPNRHPLSKRLGIDTPTNGKSATLISPTAATSAFCLGSGAFASFGTAKSTKPIGSQPDPVAKPASTMMTPKKDETDGGGDGGPATNKPNPIAKPESNPSSAPSQSSPSASTPGKQQHPLRYPWVFWFRPPITKGSTYIEYDKTLHAMAWCETVEQFFAIYRHLKRPSTLPSVSDYHLFRKGIRPIWEDEENANGGKWVVRLKKGVADRYWEDLLFAIIGDQFFEDSEEVCGAVLSVRNGEDVLSIWVHNDDGRVLRIRETMKRLLAFPSDTKIEWKSHDTSINQRTAIDESRREKANNHHHGEKRSTKPHHNPHHQPHQSQNATLFDKAIKKPAMS